MKISILRAGIRHRLIQKITSRSSRSGSVISRGFTLIELLVVVIILGILASIALPSFLNQAKKAKDASAKTLAATSAKECQLYLLDPTTSFQLTTSSGDDSISLVEDSPACPGTFSYEVEGGDTWQAEVSQDTEGNITVTPPEKLQP